MSRRVDDTMPEPTRVEVLSNLYDRLSPEERDELLRCLLMAAPRGGEAVLRVLDDELLCRVTESPLEERGAPAPTERHASAIVPLPLSMSPTAPYGAVVAGADGCRTGWFVVIQNLRTGETEHHTVPDFASLLCACGGADVIAVDIPIGLLEDIEEGGRRCRGVDDLARARLKPYRTCCVFSAPLRPAIACETYEEAVAATQAHSSKDCSLSKQAFGLFRKLREVDALMTPEGQARVREVHPELCFAHMNNDSPLLEGKKTPEGRALRIELLRTAGFEISDESVSKLAKHGVGRDDVLDAYAACWTAGRIARGQATCLGEGSAPDARGLRMEMWF